MTRTLLQHLVGDAECEALFTDDADVAAILRFEAALASACAEAGLISEAAAEVIARTLRDFIPDKSALAAGVARDGVIVPALLQQIRQRLGEHEKALHLGATSQDAIDTSLVLRLASALDLLEVRLAALARAFDALVARDGDLPMMAHTRMQRALPMTVGTKIYAWRGPLTRAHKALAALRRRLLVVQLGGPVGTRDAYGDKAELVARRLAERLDLGLADPWHTERDTIAEFGSHLSLITGGLGKFGADVGMLSQNEVAAIVVEGGGGSSAMPHKSNPVNAELLVTLARFNAGLLGTLHHSLVHEYERSGAAWTLEWLVLPQMVVATGAGLRIANALAGQIRFQAKAPE